MFDSFWVVIFCAVAAGFCYYIGRRHGYWDRTLENPHKHANFQDSGK